MTTRTITLFDRRPVTIDETNWPLIASANDYDDRAHPFQANRSWTIRIREQRRPDSGPGSGDVPAYLVYGVYMTKFESENDRRGGYLIQEDERGKADDAVVKAVWDTVERLGFETWLGDEVIAALPAERI